MADTSTYNIAHPSIFEARELNWECGTKGASELACTNTIEHSDNNTTVTYIVVSLFARILQVVKLCIKPVHRRVHWVKKGGFEKHLTAILQ